MLCRFLCVLVCMVSCSAKLLGTLAVHMTQMTRVENYTKFIFLKLFRFILRIHNVSACGVENMTF